MAINNGFVPVRFIGVVKILESFSYIKNIRVDRRNGCDSTGIANWEQRHCCTLPEDVRNFYASIDGFLLQWNLEIAGEEFSVGRMEIGNLSSLKRYPNPSKEHPAAPNRQERHTETHKGDSEPVSGTGSDFENALPPQFQGDGHSCKLFEIARCFPESVAAKVYLVYRVKPEVEIPTIWLHREDNNRWCHLADNFTVYFRMMLVHLGLPLWQCCVSNLSLPTWVEQVYFLIAPHLLPSVAETRETISSSMWNNGPTNFIDQVIFKTKEGKLKNSRKK